MQMRDHSEPYLDLVRSSALLAADPDPPPLPSPLPLSSAGSSGVLAADSSPALLRNEEESIVKQYPREAKCATYLLFLEEVPVRMATGTLPLFRLES